MSAHDRSWGISSLVNFGKLSLKPEDLWATRLTNISNLVRNLLFIDSLIASSKFNRSKCGLWKEVICWTVQSEVTVVNAKSESDD